MVRDRAEPVIGPRFARTRWRLLTMRTWPGAPQWKPHPEERAVARVSKDAPHTLPHSRDRHLPEFCKIVCASSRRGRREDRVRAAPAVSCAMGNGERRTRADRFGGNTPAFPAQWFDGLCRALPGDRLFDTIAPKQR